MPQTWGQAADAGGVATAGPPRRRWLYGQMAFRIGAFYPVLLTRLPSPGKDWLCQESLKSVTGGTVKALS